MPIERWRYSNLQTRVLGGYFGNQARQIALEMLSQRQEIGNDDDAARAGAGEFGDCSCQVRLTQFQERRLNQTETAAAGELLGNQAHGLIGRFNGGAVRKDGDAGMH